MRFALVIAGLLFAGPVLADELTRTVQEQLKSQGAYSGPLDGKPSAEFTNALKAYQARHDLPPSGVVDRATAKVLDDESGMALPDASARPQTSQPTLPPPVPRIPSPAASPYSPAIATGTPKVSASAPANSPPARISPTPPPPSAPPPPTATPVASSPAATPVGTPVPAPSPSPASPQPPGELPPQFTVERVTEFLRDFLHAGEGKYVTPQLRYFTFPVDYFGHGPVNYSFVRSDTLRYMRRWPRRHYMLTEPVKVTPVDNESATVDFTIAFSVQGGKRRASGRRVIQATLREVDGALKFAAINEVRIPD